MCRLIGEEVVEELINLRVEEELMKLQEVEVVVGEELMKLQEVEVVVEEELMKQQDDDRDDHVLHDDVRVVHDVVPHERS